jgi:hypothetical protein
MLPVTIILTIQETAVEVWMLTILGEKSTKGGFAIWMGKVAGWYIGYPIFTRLNSTNMITNYQFLCFIGIYYFFSSLVVIVFVAELKMKSGLKKISDVKHVVIFFPFNDPGRVCVRKSQIQTLGQMGNTEIYRSSICVQALRPSNGGQRIQESLDG